MARQPSKNLEVGTLEGLSWTPEARENSLEQVCKFVSDEVPRSSPKAIMRMKKGAI